MLGPRLSVAATIIPHKPRADPDMQGMGVLTSLRESFVGEIGEGTGKRERGRKGGREREKHVRRRGNWLALHITDPHPSTCRLPVTVRSARQRRSSQEGLGPDAAFAGVHARPPEQV